jgi:hypothetical protein
LVRDAWTGRHRDNQRHLEIGGDRRFRCSDRRAKLAEHDGRLVNGRKPLHDGGALRRVAARVVDLECDLIRLAADLDAASLVDVVGRKLKAVELEFAGRGQRAGLGGDDAEGHGAIGRDGTRSRN